MNLPDTHAAIAALIPHQGSMCLLERVVECTADDIVCTSRSHLHTDHPLRLLGRLSAVHLCEYGAQAVAVHGALTTPGHSTPARPTTARPTPARPGMLVALRDVQLHTDYLDAVIHGGHELHVRAKRIHASDSGCLYEFEVSANHAPLASGKATIMNRSAG